MLILGSSGYVVAQVAGFLPPTVGNLDLAFLAPGDYSDILGVNWPMEALFISLLLKYNFLRLLT